MVKWYLHSFKSQSRWFEFRAFGFEFRAFWHRITHSDSFYVPRFIYMQISQVTSYLRKPAQRLFWHKRFYLENYPGLPKDPVQAYDDVTAGWLARLILMTFLQMPGFTVWQPWFPNYHVVWRHLANLHIWILERKMNSNARNTNQRDWDSNECRYHYTIVYVWVYNAFIRTRYTRVLIEITCIQFYNAFIRIGDISIRIPVARVRFRITPIQNTRTCSNNKDTDSAP